MMFLSLLCGPALAGAIYINGVRADVVPEITMKNVTVRFDADGNVFVDAPQYRVEAVAPAASTGKAPASGAATSVAPASTGAPIPAGVWWLVSEDHQSTGEAVSVLVNGVQAYRVASGQGPIVLDLAPFLRHGNNEIRMEPVANGTLGGGALDLYVGHGSNDQGTLRIDQALVHYSRSPSDPVGPRTYTLAVP